MKTIDSIPITKIERASKLVKTGAQVGVNYLKYVGDKFVNNPVDARSRLDKNNAEDIYNSLKTLKGSALKVAQMLSMEKSMLPKAYVEQFSLAQFSVPALSAPLVIKSFKKYFGKSPEELFDKFNLKATNAASIGQVHQAVKDGKKYAVKIQYPGVAESISSDLSLIKPIAIRMFNIKGKDSDKYFTEVETKLLEETNYHLEIDQSKAMAQACEKIKNLRFPKYYSKYSSNRIITMDWMDGQHVSDFASKNEDRKKANKIGQTLWDFYMFQIHNLKKVHADPHPGNFLINEKEELIVLDFGCLKEIPEQFYRPYFELAEPKNLSSKEIFRSAMFELEIIKKEDSNEEQLFFEEMFHDMLSVFTLPFHSEIFDFSDADFFNKIAALGEKYSKDTKLRKMNGNRGSKHFIYMNRTFFGLYNLMFDLKADRVIINNFNRYNA